MFFEIFYIVVTLVLLRRFNMKLKIFFVPFFVLCVLFFAWCSMMPSDEEFIRWFSLETEIFGDELDNEGIANDKEIDENLQDEDVGFIESIENSDGDENDDSEIQFEILD